jgi:galactonate dehydratase
LKIERLETFWIDEQPNTMWLRIHTDEGLVGTGETFYAPRAVSALIHDVLAQLLLGRSAFEIERHFANLFATVNFFGFAGAEMRAISAIDIALWDLVAQHAGQPVYNALGGRVRDRVRVYNTCVNYGTYADLDRWRDGDAGALAEELLEQGVTAMKIWPFDVYGPSLGGPIGSRAGGAVGPLGHYLSAADLKAALRPLEQIRERVGDRMGIAIEGHGRWDLPVATRIARALEPFDVLWLEDVMPADNVDAYERLTSATSVPICASERLMTRFQFRSLIERGAVDIVMPDVVWTGGLTESRKIAALADTHFLPLTTHDTVGPIALVAGGHLALHAPNAMIVETVRGYYDGWYNEVLTEPIVVRDGHLELSDRPGLGTAIRDEVLERPDVHIESTTRADVPDLSHA